MELQGFKSFADKTEITFQDGITVIVGPNGCGKSNVSDAIKWVLGEQRPTSMRGQSMTDVIFNGTEVRRSLSYAEVSLYFDNRNRIFPIDCDDVVLGRKIDRSGVGEYYINKQKCRLKDVVSLLHDTGIGREGYSIVGQGRVAQIIQAKPVDRRSIFEEAAGIANFKAQKAETERKLDRANESIARVKDILHEIEVRLEPLARQARAAEKYNALYSELKDAEINYFIYRYENNKSVVDAITEKLQKIILDTVKYEQEYQENETKYEEFKAEVAKIDEEISVLNEELLRLNVSLATAEGESKLYTERALSVNNEIKRLEAEETARKSELDEKSKELVDKVTDKEVKSSELEKLEKELAAVTTKYNEVSEKLDSDERAREISQRNLVLTAEELGNIKANLGKYIAERDMSAKRLEFLEGTLKDKKAELDREYVARSVLEGNVTVATNNVSSLEITLNDAVASLHDNRETLNSFYEDKNKFTNRITALETKHTLAVQAKESYDSFGRAIQLLMADMKVNPELKKRSQGLVAEIIRTPEGMEVAMDVAFGNGLRNIVTNNEEDAKYIIDFLKRRGYGQVTFQPINVRRGRRPDAEQSKVLKEHGVIGFAADLIEYESRFEGVIRGMLGNTLVVNNLDTAIGISKSYRYMFKIVTLDGDFIAQHGAITGGSRKPDVANILAKDREIAEIKANLDKARRDFDNIMKLCAEAERDIAENEKTIKESESAISALKIQLSVTEEKLNKSSESIAAYESDIKAQAEEINSLKDSVRDTEEKLRLADKMESDIKAQRENADVIAEQSKSVSDENKKLQAELSDKMITLRLEVTRLKTDIDQGDLDINRLKKECQSISNLLLDVNASLTTNRASLKQIEDAGRRKVVSEADRRKIEDIQGKLESFKNVKVTTNEEISVIDGKRDTLNKNINDLRERRFREENKLEQTNREIKYLHEHIWEEYELTYQSALEFKNPEFEIKDAQQNISRLKKSINALGDVNPHAIEEYKEVSERYEKETAQCEDLEKGKADLLKIIDDLTNEMTTRFTDAFNEINDNFKVTFSALFGGGRAKLELVEDPDGNALESGIEIYAQPPGKRMQKISLYSGGEQTLIAIAILFAIIKMRPMPFCVLDEIDTALDDANAGLLAQYLKHFSERTQFIIISHRKPTMEISDNIFGVSMEESGVSTLLSVNLTEALKYATKEG